MRTKIKYAPVIAAISVGLAAGTLTMAPAASAQDWFTDAETCAEANFVPWDPAIHSGTNRGFSYAPGATDQRPLKCGGSLKFNANPRFPTDGTPVTVTSGLGMVAIPCAYDRSAVNPSNGRPDTSYGLQYVGLPNAAFSRTTDEWSKWSNADKWRHYVEYRQAELSADYAGGLPFIANAEGTYNLVGEFTDQNTGELKKCNATITITDTATVTTPTENTESRKCVKAKNKLAALKEADASKKKIRKAKKARTAACRA